MPVRRGPGIAARQVPIATPRSRTTKTRLVARRQRDHSRECTRTPKPRVRMTRMRRRDLFDARAESPRGIRSPRTMPCEPADILSANSRLLSRQYGAENPSQEPAVRRGQRVGRTSRPRPPTSPYRTRPGRPRTRRSLIPERVQPTYWVGFGVRVALIERASARPMFAVALCYTDTIKHAAIRRRSRISRLRTTRSCCATCIARGSRACKCFGRIAAGCSVAESATPFRFPPSAHLLDPLAATTRGRQRPRLR